MTDNKNEVKYPTLKDVAELAGVSPITVSRVFNDKWSGRVKEDTVKKVSEAAKKLGYSPNQLARSLTGERTNIIAVVTGEKTGLFYDELLHNLTTKIQKNGQQALVFVADPSYGIEKIVEQVNQFRVDAIIVTSPALKSDIMNFFTNAKRPIVLFNRHIKQSTASAVWSDDVMGMRQLADYIEEKNYKDVAFIAGPEEGHNEMERDMSFIKEMTNRRLPLMKVLDGDYTYESGFEQTLQLFREGLKPELIVCSGDNMAFGAMDALRFELGLKVPEDVSVTGFDDNSIAGLKSYDLTSVHQPFDEMIDATIEVVEALIKNPEKQHLIPFDTHLVLRSSTRSVPKG